MKVRVRHNNTTTDNITYVRSEKTTKVRRKLLAVGIALVMSVLLNCYLYYKLTH